MIDLLSTTQVLLREAGFSTRRSLVDRDPIVCFEDGALIGFCSTFDTTGEMIARWKGRESQILAKFAPNFRAAGEKAWNVYCGFLCADGANEEQQRRVSWIEEDLERTRKIAACNVQSRDDLVRALLPVLPIQYQPVLSEEDTVERLKRRVADIAPRAVHVALDTAVPAEEVVRMIGDRS